MRFLLYAVASMTYLEGLLYGPAAAVWYSRELRYVSQISTYEMVC